MIDQHFLDNMIYNLEKKKNLKKVEFTKDAVRETLEYLHALKGKDQRIAELEEENAKLQEQLKNAIVPKFKGGQIVWFLSDPYDAKYRKLQKMKIEEISISSLFVEREIMYAGSGWAGISEKEIFATEAEAQKHMKEVEE